MKYPLVDPTFEYLQHEPPTPGSTGIVVSASTSSAQVSFQGRTLSARVPAVGTVAAGDSVSVVNTDGMWWALKQSAGYPSRYPRPLADFNGTNPAGVLLCYLLKDNPRDYTYRACVVLVVLSTTLLSISMGDRTLTVGVEYAGVAQTTGGISVGDTVLAYQKNPGQWVALTKATGEVTWEDPAEESVQYGETIAFNVAVESAQTADVVVDFSTGGTAAASDFTLLPVSPVTIPAGDLTSEIILVAHTTGDTTTNRDAVFTITSAVPGSVGAKKTKTITLAKTTAFYYRGTVRTSDGQSGVLAYAWDDDGNLVSGSSVTLVAPLNGWTEIQNIQSNGAKYRFSYTYESSAPDFSGGPPDPPACSYKSTSTGLDPITIPLMSGGNPLICAIGSYVCPRKLTVTYYAELL
jgi:hypothetical protein